MPAKAFIFTKPKKYTITQDEFFILGNRVQCATVHTPSTASGALFHDEKLYCGS